MQQERLAKLVQKLKSLNKQEEKQLKQLVKDISAQIDLKSNQLKRQIHKNLGFQTNLKNLKEFVLKQCCQLQLQMEKFQILMKQKSLSPLKKQMVLLKLLKKFIDDLADDQKTIYFIMKAFQETIKLNYSVLNQNSSEKDLITTIQYYQNHKDSKDNVEPDSPIQIDPPSPQPPKIFPQPEPVEHQNTREYRQRDIFEAQVKKLQPSQWRLDIKFSPFQCSIGKFPNYDQPLYYFQSKFQLEMSSPSQFKEKQLQPARNFYNTLNWVIKLILAMKQNSLSFTQNGKQKSIKIKSIIDKIGFLINRFSDNVKQNKLCYLVIKTIANLSVAKGKDFEVIQRIAKSVQRLQNCNIIKEKLLNESIRAKLKDTRIEQKKQEQHRFFREYLFANEQLSEDEQSTIENVAVFLLHYQKVHTIKSIDHMFQECFTKEGKTGKEEIIRNIYQQLRLIQRPIKLNLFSQFKKIISIFQTKS